MNVKDISIKKIRIPHRHRRIDGDDGSITRSMDTEGMKDPIIVVPNKNEYILADGGRRLKAARRLKWKTIQSSIRKPTNGENPETYASLLRLTINHHRQGFYPSQRAHYLRILQKKYNVSIDEIAEACGVTSQSAKIWMAVSDCSEEIQMFIDDGKFPLDSGKWVNSLKPQGQMLIANKFRSRLKVSLKELKTFVSQIHKRYPEYIKVSLKTRRARMHKKNPELEHGTYRKYSNMGIAELEGRIGEAEKEIVFMRREILRAAPIIKAICKNGKLRLALPGDSLRKFETFLLETSHG